MDRRQFLNSGLASATGLMLARQSLAADPLKIGFVYPGPISDGGWTYQHELGRRLIEQEFGARIKTIYVENVPETADAERVIRQMVAQDCKMIFTTSFGFMESTLKVAKQSPDVMFEHATGYKMAKNVGIYQNRFYEGAYLLGQIAGRMTKTNILGFVGSVPIPEVLRNIDSYTLGALSVNPKISTKVIWVNTWYDPAKEKQAGEVLVSQGADVLYQGTDSAALMQLAQEKGLFAFGQDSDMLKYGPKAQLTANTCNWAVYYRAKVQQALDGKWKAEDTKWGLKEDMVEVMPLNAAIPADVVKRFNDTKAAIVAGKFHPFSGPVVDQDGKMRVAAGQTLSESDLWAINWYVKGVEGRVPG